MDSSTPLKPTGSSLRRRTLLRTIDTPIAADTVNDDSERSSRRSFIEMQKKNTSVGQSPSLNDSVRFSGEQEIKDHFQICTKLHAENKITARVAWQLQIIDLLKVVSKKPGTDTLQVASTSLDIGAKVYGLRVDDIHAEGLKLANSMARFAEKQQEPERDGDGDGAPAAEEDGPSKRKKRKLRRGGPKSTIAKDPKSLLGPLPKLDSMFFSTRIDSELSTVENLFTNRLAMDTSCSKFMVMTKEKAWPSGRDLAVTELDKVRPFDVDLLPKGGDICIPFKNFVLDQWDPEEEEQNQTQTQKDEDVVVFDEQGLPVHELDGSIHDAFNDNNDDIMEEDDVQEDFVVQQMQREIAPVVDLITVEDSRRSEYSYNSLLQLGNGKVIEKIWAGPSHWKLKCIRRSKSNFTGNSLALNVAKPKKKKTAYEPQPVDFDDIDGIVEKLDSMKRITFKKKINPSSKVTLPLPDSSCIKLLKELYELMIKPGSVPVTKKAKSEITSDEGNFDNDKEYGADNAEPEMDYGMDHMDDDHGADDMIHDEEEIAVNHQHQFMGDNLVDAPEYVPKTYVPYALQAKKMDMKKLKTFIWDLLTGTSLEKSATVKQTTFSKTFKELPTVLPQAMRKELSCPLAFSALLHLCNEHNLKLTQLTHARDFKIESG